MTAQEVLGVVIPLAIIFAVFGLIAFVITRPEKPHLCDDGKAHEWQVWVFDGHDWSNRHVLRRTCLKCGWAERKSIEIKSPD